MNVEPQGGEAGDAGLGDADGVVGRIVEHLDLQAVARVVERRHRVNQALDDVLLVVERQLYGYHRPLGGLGRDGRLPVGVFLVEIDHPVAVQPVEGQRAQDGEVGDEQEKVEGVQVVEPAEGVVGQEEAQVALHGVGREQGCEHFRHLIS
ncbi:MAG: hypothetical protein A3D93_06030 [Acidobacteria bacterium RIFCSPHIGHO2_12_FULL_67_30]|nr:MAG: hypothetical protein A3D93_06030 [Acidobacteria bacterium RIFCSPHIGHO2_12_FULL_67_30]